MLLGSMHISFICWMIPNPVLKNLNVQSLSAIFPHRCFKSRLVIYVGGKLKSLFKLRLHPLYLFPSITLFIWVSMTNLAGGLLFSTLDQWGKPDMWGCVHALNTAYKVPDLHHVAGELLPQCYNQLSSELKELIGDVEFLNFVSDESDDKARRRIANLSVNTPQQGAFFLRSFHTKDQNQTASFLASLIILEIIDACNNDLSRFNSLATDTCAT